MTSLKIQRRWCSIHPHLFNSSLYPRPKEAFFFLTAPAGSFLSGRLMDTALPRVSIPLLFKVISRVCLSFLRPPASSLSSLQSESCFYIVCLFRAFFFPLHLHMLAQFSPPAPTNLSPPAAPPIWKQSSPSYISYIKKYPHSVHTSDLVLHCALCTGSCTFAFSHTHPGPDGVTLQSPIFLEKGRISLQLLI